MEMHHNIASDIGSVKAIKNHMDTIIASVVSTETHEKDIQRINNTISETLKPLEVLAEENATVIKQLTDDITVSIDSIKEVVDVNNNLTSMNLSLTNLCEEVRNELNEQKKSNELTNMELRIGTIYGIGVTLLAIIEALYLFVF